MTAHKEITARLLLGGIAGPHCSHSREDNVLKASQLASGDPDSTFGMADVASATTEEGLDAVQAVTGAREPGEAYIDPDATIAGVRAASARLGEACRNGATIVVATGHPGPLLGHHTRLVEAITAAGGKLIRPLDEMGVTLAGARRIYRYLRGVGAVTDGVRGLHTHSPLPMEQVLEDGERPELVFADHGFAGAAVSRGIPVIACMDTNDTALAVAHARGRDITLIPLDDGRRPDAYDVIAEMFEQELGTGALGT
ncbi:MAG TPA: phosphatase [Actinomycetota bacterium]